MCIGLNFKRVHFQGCINCTISLRLLVAFFDCCLSLMQINRIWMKFARRGNRIEHMVGQRHELLSVKYSKLPVILDMSTLIVFPNLRHKSWKEGIILQLPSYSYNIDASK